MVLVGVSSVVLSSPPRSDHPGRRIADEDPEIGLRATGL